MSDATADERLTAGMQVFLECLTKAGAKVEKLDKSLIDHHIAELDYQISRQLDAVMHHDEFQAVESLWRGVKSLIDKTDFRQNVKIELLSMSKEELRQDFEDSPEVIQSGLYKHTYIDEYDSAPQGVAFTSGEHLQMTSKLNTILSAGQHLDMGAMKNITLAASESIGLFAHQSGAKLIANQGDVEIRAEASSMEMTSEQLFTISSTVQTLRVVSALPGLSVKS